MGPGFFYTTVSVMPNLFQSTIVLPPPQIFLVFFWLSSLARTQSVLSQAILPPFKHGITSIMYRGCWIWPNSIFWSVQWQQ